MYFVDSEKAFVPWSILWEVHQGSDGSPRVQFFTASCTSWVRCSSIRRRPWGKPWRDYISRLVRECQTQPLMLFSSTSWVRWLRRGSSGLFGLYKKERKRKLMNGCIFKSSTILYTLLSGLLIWQLFN